MRPGQQRRGKIGLQLAFSATKSHAAAGFAVKGTVLLHLVEHLICRHLLPEQVEALVGHTGTHWPQFVHRSQLIRTLLSGLSPEPTI